MGGRQTDTGNRPLEAVRGLRTPPAELRFAFLKSLHRPNHQNDIVMDVDPEVQSVSTHGGHGARRAECAAYTIPSFLAALLLSGACSWLPACLAAGWELGPLISLPSRDNNGQTGRQQSGEKEQLAASTAANNSSSTRSPRTTTPTSKRKVSSLAPSPRSTRMCGCTIPVLGQEHPPLRPRQAIESASS